MAESAIKRRYPRLKPPRSTLVAWKTAEYREVSHVSTIAMGGLFIRTKNPAKVGSMLQLMIVAPRGNVRVRANVCSVIEGEGMGVAIMAMEPEDRGKLERWLNQLSGKD